MSRRAPAYTPLCNRHVRFYFSNPERQQFQDVVSERQFLAVKAAVSELPEQDRQWLKSVIFPSSRNADLLDAYIWQRLEMQGVSRAEVDRFSQMLLRINRKIAISLGYVST